MAGSVNLAGVEPEADSLRTEPSTCSMVGVRTPFNLAEEGWQFRHPLDETPNIQLELRFSGSLDGHELQRAILAAVAVHPMTRASKEAGRALLCPPRWMIGEPELGNALRSIRCRDETELSAARDAFYNQTIDLGKAPALRFLLAHLPGGDALLLNVHHSVADGLGSLRFLHSVARAYGGRPDPAPLIDPLAVRDIKAYFGPAASTRDENVNPPPSPAGTRAFLAPEGTRGEAGFGFRHVALSHEECRGLDPRRLEPSATVNDLLLAALHRAIGEWNTRRCHPCDCIAVFMPVNFRPSEWRHEVVANLTGGGMVTSMPDQRSSDKSLLGSVASQTRWIKHYVSSMVALALPNWILKLFPVLMPMLRRMMGDRVANTALLSNLGRLDDVPDFGARAGKVTEFWFSPPCSIFSKPLGLAMGVAGLEGRQHLVFRYRRSLFDAEAAGRFSDLFFDCLDRLGRGGR